MKKNIILDIIVALTMFLFLYAASSKVLEYDEFRVQLSRSPMTARFYNELTFLVPAVEIAICLLLAIPKTKLMGLYASFCLMYAFTAYIAIMMIFSPTLPCSCGGILSRMEWGDHLVFNIVFVLLCYAGVILEASKKRQVISTSTISLT
jgi:hypothetical protein